jgi:hypothetical protein
MTKVSGSRSQVGLIEGVIILLFLTSDWVELLIGTSNIASVVVVPCSGASHVLLASLKSVFF